MTRPQLILYCERRAIISCLLIEMLRRRPNLPVNLKELMERLGDCPSYRKIQVVLPVDELVISKDTLARMIAGVCHNITPDDIEIIAVTTSRYERQALLGLPAVEADALLHAERRNLQMLLSVDNFDRLSLAVQSRWRHEAAGDWHRREEALRYLSEAIKMIQDEIDFTQRLLEFLHYQMPRFRDMRYRTRHVSDLLERATALSLEIGIVSSKWRDLTEKQDVFERILPEGDRYELLSRQLEQLHFMLQDLLREAARVESRMKSRMAMEISASA